MLWEMGIALRILFLSLLILFVSCNPNSFESHSPKPLIVLTFDDCRQSIYTLAFQEMKLYGFPGVNYFPVAWLEISGYLTLKNLHEMEEYGWESGGHSYTHPDLTVISLDSAHAEIRKNYQFLIDNRLMHNSFALPAGRSNAEIDKVILKYFSIIRTSINERYHCPLDVQRLGYYQVENNDDVNSLLARISRIRGFLGGKR